MDKNAYFWQVMKGKLPPPGAAATLNIRFRHIDASATAPALVRKIPT